MAIIDSKKLLPPSKRTTNLSIAAKKILVPISNVKKKDSARINPEDLKTEKENISISDQFLDLRKKLEIISKILENTTVYNKKEFERKRKVSEKKRFESREKSLESPSVKGSSAKSIIPKQGFNFFEYIKRFLSYTFFGFIFDKLSGKIPQLLNVARNLSPIFNFVEDFSGNILNGIVNFIDFGYDTKKKFDSIVENIGGKESGKKFDEFSKNLNVALNAAIIAAMAASGIKSGSRDGGKIKPQGTVAGSQSAARYGYRPQPLPEGVKPGTVEGRGITSQQRIARRAEGKAARRIAGAQLRRGSVGETAEQIAKKGSKKFIGRLAGKAFGRIPIIGGLVDFLFALWSGEKPGRAAAKAVGATIGSALGTFVPVPFVGTILGGILGDIVGGALYDTLSQQQKPKKYAKGGSVTRSGKKVGGTIGRNIKPIRKRNPTKVNPQKTNPGKDIGGKGKIEKLFSKEIPGKKSALRSLKKTSEILKRIPLFGPIMGASVDIAMGQKPSRTVYGSISNFFGATIQSIIDNKVHLSVSDLQRQIYGMANGGVIPQTTQDVGNQLTDILNKSFSNLIQTRLNDIFTNITKELSLRDPVSDTLRGPIPNGDSGGFLPGTQVVGYVGTTGSSTGPHIHIETGDGYSGAGGNIPENVLSNVIVGGKSLNKWSFTSGIGWRWGKMHKGLDYGIPEGTPIQLTGGLKFVKYSAGDNAGYGNVLLIQDSSGKTYLLGHLQKGPANPEEMARLQRKHLGESLSRMRRTGNSLTGEASWYGPGFHGKRTASGETYDMNKMTAAMYQPGWGVGSNPFYVEVTNLSNGKKVRVKVNDTGPFAMSSNGEPIYPLRPHPRRIIDLSKAAMNRLGGSGVINVSVQKLGSAPRTAPPQQNQDLAQQPTGNVTGYGKVYGTEYFYSNGKYWERKNGKTKEIDSQIYATIRSNHAKAFGIKSGIDVNKLKLPGGGYRDPKNYQASVSSSQQRGPSVEPLKMQTGYEIASNYVIIKQKEVIKESIPVGGGYFGGFSGSSIDSNNIAESLV